MTAREKVLKSLNQERGQEDQERGQRKGSSKKGVRKRFEA
jgi:hypothetical protein